MTSAERSLPTRTGGDTILPMLEVFSHVWPAVRANAFTDIAAHLPGGYRDGTVLLPSEAADYLHAIRKSVIARARSVADLYSPIRWLWYTRRLPRDVFEGYLPTTAPTDHALMEALSALSASRSLADRTVLDGSAVYPIDEQSLLPLAQLGALAVVLGKVHGWLRRAGKQTHFTVFNDRFPEPVQDETLEAAIDDFDRRVALTPVPAWLQGLELVTAAGEVADWLMLTLGVAPGQWSLVPGWEGLLGDGELVPVLGQFLVLPTSLTGLRHAIQATGDDRVWWPDSLPALVLLLQILMRAAQTTAYSMGRQVPTTGYTVWNREGLRRLIAHDVQIIGSSLDALFPGSVPATADDVLGLVATLDVELWPFQLGPVLRAIGDAVVIDIYAATRRLQSMTTMPRGLGGDLTNAISGRFEVFVQDGLDHSDWAPTPKYRALRGRVLQLRGHRITDIDAIGQCGRRVLLVSCKNIPYSAEYDAGDMRTVQNAETRIDAAVRHWRNVLATLEEDPVGDNYDLSGVDLLGVVVTPQVMFSRSEESTRPIQLDPLRASSGAGELFKAVNATDAWRRPR